VSEAVVDGQPVLTLDKVVMRSVVWSRSRKRT